MSSTGSDERPAVEYQQAELTVYSDGSIHRAPFVDPPLVPACPSPSPFQVASKDVPLNPSFATSLRLFLPPSASPSLKLPIFLYIHGGAFLHFCTGFYPVHHYLCRLAAHANALIVSVDYRLTPEHPFPAAYEDCFEGLLWLNQQALRGASGEPWLAHHGDFSRCFLVGDSAGGTAVHYLAMQAVGHGSWKSQHQEKVLDRVSLKGLLLIHPFFTCRGEARMPRNSLECSVLKYVKVGAEDPLLDPLSPAAPSLASAALPRVLVFVAELDELKERGVVYYEGLVKAGKQVKLSVAEKETHGFHVLIPDSPNAIPLLDEVRDFTQSV